MEKRPAKISETSIETVEKASYKVMNEKETEKSSVSTFNTDCQSFLVLTLCEPKKREYYFIYDYILVFRRSLCY